MHSVGLFCMTIVNVTIYTVLYDNGYFCIYAKNPLKYQQHENKFQHKVQSMDTGYAYLSLFKPQFVSIS